MMGKRMTREQKRRIQRRMANVTGILVIALLLAAGFAAGRLF